MSRKNVQMRGLKVCVIGCSDRDNHHLAQQFSRIGIEGLFCTVFPDESQLADQQLLVFDGDNSTLFHPTNPLPWPALPKVALTAIETPSRLQWIAEQKIDSYMRKFLFSAQLRVMNALGLDEDDAYSLLRRASMAQHMTIENLSCALLNDTEAWLSRLKSLLVE